MRPGPPARSRTPSSDGASPTPLHRAVTGGRRTGTRMRVPERSRSPKTVGLAVTAVAVVAAGAFWVSDLREPDRTDVDALPGASAQPGAGATPSVGPAASAAPTAAPSAGASTDPSALPGADLGVGPNAGASGGATAGPVAPSTPDPATAALLAVDRAPAVAAATGPTRDASATRTALEQVLSARAAATVSLLRAVIAGDLDAAVPAASSVDATSADLEQVVTAWRDPAVAAQLRSAFDAQTVASRTYATAVRADDEAAADTARADMGATSRALGQLLEQLTSQAITRFVPPEDAARLRDLVDAQAAGDTASADDVAAWFTARAGREGVALATALAGPA